MTSPLKVSALLCGVPAIVALQSEPSAAQRRCFTDGTRPFCKGMLECPRNYERVRSTRSGCIGGHIITCCEELAHRKSHTTKKKKKTRD